MKKYTNQELLSTVKVSSAITRLGIPAIIGMLIMAIYNFVDTLFIGQLGSDSALSAVAVAFPIMLLMSAIGQILGAGSAAAIGRAFGKQEYDYANKISSTAIYVSIVSGILFMAIGLVFIEQIFYMFGASKEIMEVAKQYGGWMYIGCIFTIPSQVFNNLARAQTKSILSMCSLGLGAILNIILDPIFMFELGGFGLNMGIEGASMATTISQAISTLFIAYYFFFDKLQVRIRLRYFSLKKKLVNDVLSSGLPIGLFQMLNTMTVSFTNIVVLQVATTPAIGIDMQSAYGVVLKVVMIFQYILLGYLQGYQPVASYSYGSLDKKRFYQSFYFLVKIILIYTSITTVVIMFISPILISMFTTSPQVLEMGTTLLRYSNLFFVLFGFSLFLMLTFQATGNGKFGAIISLSRQAFLYLPALFILGNLYGVEGIYYVQAAADLGTACICVVLYKLYKKELEKHFNK